ncbi:MAG: YraN family protein [Anaerolineae bacterium]|nr:YraN family protein [Anaerolineae bacterium]
MTKRRQALGRWGEDRAARYLVAAGCDVIATNWRCPAGEVDLIVRDGETLAFVEVRTRRGTAYGTPEESVTALKLAHMIDVAQTYVQERDWEGPWRLDVVAIQVRSDGPPSIEWYRSVTG